MHLQFQLNEYWHITVVNYYKTMNSIEHTNTCRFIVHNPSKFFAHIRCIRFRETIHF